MLRGWSAARSLCRASRSLRNRLSLSESEILDRCREIARAFATVEEMLRAQESGHFWAHDYGCLSFVENDPALLEEERGRIRFLLVDEFQDANFAQVEVLSLLAGEAANLFVVGDPDQAIYQFRGASSEAFSLFRRKFRSDEVGDASEEQAVTGSNSRVRVRHHQGK